MADSSHAKKQLNWASEVEFEALVSMMVEADYNYFKRHDFQALHKLNLLPDGTGWVTSWENSALGEILSKLNIDVVSQRLTPFQGVIFQANIMLVRFGYYTIFCATGWPSITFMAIPALHLNSNRCLRN